MIISDFLFPIKCFGCSKKGNYICVNCFEKQFPARQICVFCKKASLNGKTHQGCKQEGYLDQVYSVWKYRGLIKKGIKTFKYRFSDKLSDDFTSALCPILKKLITEKDNCLLVPIPLHRSRKNWRGFNQAEIVCESLSEKLNISYQDKLLKRNKNTIPQAELKKTKRSENIKNSFLVNKKLINKVRNHKIILFDDVVTTGSTLNEAARVLKRWGIENVSAITVAR